MHPASRLLVALTICAASGCVTENDNGDLRTMWTIGLDEPSIETCDRAGIDSVELLLDSELHDTSDTSSCHAGQRTFRGIPVSSYTITLQGLDETGCPLYEGTVDGATPSDEGIAEEIDVVLEKLPVQGTVSVEWMFGDGRLCGVHEVDTVTVTILSDDVEQAITTLDCEEGGWELLAVPAGSVDVMLQATEGDTELCHVETNLTLAPCAELDILAVLDPC